MIQPNKTIAQQLSQKNLIPESDFRKLRQKAQNLGADSFNYSKRKNLKYVVDYNGKKIHFGSAKTEDYITHKDKDRRLKYLNKAKKIKDKDGRLTYKFSLNIIKKVQELCQDHLSREYGENESSSLTDMLYYKQIEYVGTKGKTKKKKDESSSPVLYVKLVYSSETKKFSTIFRLKGKQEVKPLEYKDKFFNTRMAIIFDSIYLGGKSISIQVKAHEVHILPFEERKPLLEYIEEEEEEVYDKIDELLE